MRARRLLADHRRLFQRAALVRELAGGLHARWDSRNERLLPSPQIDQLNVRVGRECEPSSKVEADIEVILVSK